jgi:hypothetical protein
MPNMLTAWVPAPDRTGAGKKEVRETREYMAKMDMKCFYYDLSRLDAWTPRHTVFHVRVPQKRRAYAVVVALRSTPAADRHGGRERGICGMRAENSPEPLHFMVRSHYAKGIVYVFYAHSVADVRACLRLDPQTALPIV